MNIDSKRCLGCGCEIPQARKRCWKCSQLRDYARSSERSEATRRAWGIKPRAFKASRTLAMTGERG